MKRPGRTVTLLEYTLLVGTLAALYAHNAGLL